MLKKLCDQLGVRERVTFCGWVSPVMPFFRAMDINLLSSVSETFPYSILEGVCAGCATICSDVGGMPELIDTGENGYIFRSGTISGWRNIWSVWATMPNCGRNSRTRCTKKPPAISRATKCANVRWKTTVTCWHGSTVRKTSARALSSAVLTDAATPVTMPSSRPLCRRCASSIRTHHLRYVAQPKERA